MQAVILAAGLGSRLGNLTDRQPKGLLEVGGRSLLSRSLRALASKAFTDIVIVTGYRGAMIEAHLARECPDVKLDFVHNADFRTTGSMVSLALAKTRVKAPFAVLEADLLYDPRFLDFVRGDGATPLLLTAEASGSGDEVYVVADASGRLSYLGKAANAAQRDRAIGEFAGISRLTERFYRAYCARVDALSNANDANRHYEEIFLDLARDGYDVDVRHGAGLAWGEVDTPADLARAKKKVLPRLSAVN